MRTAIVKSRLAAARKLASPCRLCPRRCGVDRLAGETGYCGAGAGALVFMAYVHWAEDADIVPAQTLYLRGCNLACEFCQTMTERRRLPARTLTPGLLADILAKGKSEGARTLDVLGGEPTVNLPALFSVLAETEDFPGLVWNTNLYGTAEAFRLLDGVADIFLGDVKFGNPDCAARLSGAADAGETARERAEEIFRRRPEALIARHLAVPGHFDCCTRPILEWFARALPGVRVSLRTVFMPPGDMRRGLRERRFSSEEETRAVLNLAKRLGLRLTRDARPPEPGPGGGEGTEFEVVIAADGKVYARHATREAMEMLRAAGTPDAATKGDE